MRSIEARYKGEDHWRNAERRLGEWSGYSLRLRRFDWTCIGLLWLVLAGSALGIGAVFVPVLVLVSSVAVASVMLCGQAGYSSWRGLPLTALCLAAVCLLQAVPLPLAWIEALAPHNADVWLRAFRPLDLPPPRWVSLSLDPGATWVEVLKWCTYAATLFTASVVRRTAGKRVILFLVFSSAVLVGVVALVHRLVNAESLFGFYQPRFAWEVAPLLNPNNLAGYLSLGTFSGLGLLLDPRPRTARYRWFLGVAVSGLISLVVLTESRAGLASLGLGLALLAIVTLTGRAKHPKATPLSSFVPLGAAIGGGAVFIAFSSRPTMIKELLGQGMQKLNLFRWTLPMIRDHFWLGVGRGAFETAFQPYRLGGGNAVFTHAENFLIQWVSEWGAPIAALAIGTFVWLLWPRKKIEKRDPLSACAYVGLFTLLAQNLFDLALEVPAVAIALSVICGGLIECGKREAGPATPRASSIALQPASYWLFISLELCGLVGSLVFGRHTAIRDRDLLHQAYEAIRHGEVGAPDHFQRTLKAAISRHPGDGYLPLLAGITARATGQNTAMSWLSRALERDPMNGRTHLALAQELVKRGARSQALMELRLATDREGALVPKAAVFALSWANTSAELFAAAPAGVTGADMLVTISRQATESQKEELLREALRRNPENTDAQMDLGMWVAHKIASNAPDCAGLGQASCVSEIDTRVEALRRLGTGAQWARLKATLLGALGKPDEALHLLHEACPGTVDQRICFAVALSIAVRSNLRLDETIAQYLGSCAGPQECANSEIDVGDALASKDQWGGALAHYTRAAQVLHTARSWIRVAEVAEQAGAYAQARTAIERARNDPEHTDPPLQKKLLELEERSTSRQLKQEPASLP